MRKLALLGILAACGGDDTASPDSPGGNHPPPMVIAGGGISGGAIDGVVNLYVIDDATRMPIQGATVRVGTVDGTTDATGLFVANGLTGKQDVVVTAAGYRSEYWLGANGANMTADLHPANPATTQATLSGSIDLSGITVGTGHAKVAAVTYSQDDLLADAENNLKTPNNGNVCIEATPTATCNFQVLTRTGKVTLYALIFDYDTKGTTTTADDTETLVAYASRTGVMVSDGVAQTAQDLTVITQTSTVSVDFGTPPSALTTWLGLVGIEMGDGSGVIQLPITSNTVMSAPAPALSNFSGAMYRLSAIAQNTATPPNQAITLHRHQSTTSLAAGTWTPPPSDVTVTRTSATWTNVAGAVLHGVEYDSGATAVLSITSFDGTATATIPDIVTIPSGSLTVKVQALAGTGIDVTDLQIDRDREKLTAVGVANVALN